MKSAEQATADSAQPVEATTNTEPASAVAKLADGNNNNNESETKNESESKAEPTATAAVAAAPPAAVVAVPQLTAPSKQAMTRDGQVLEKGLVFCSFYLFSVVPRHSDDRSRIARLRKGERKQKCFPFLIVYSLSFKATNEAGLNWLIAECEKRNIIMPQSHYVRFFVSNHMNEKKVID